MNIITKKLEKINTIIVMDFKEDISEYIGDNLPYPSSHFIQKISREQTLYRFLWNIQGFFGTKNSIDFYNDIISRFLLSFKDYGVNHNKTYRTLKSTTTELKHFQGLQSLSNTRLKIRKDRDTKLDYVFWCLKDYAELRIKETGIIIYNDLLDFGYIHFKDHKKGFKSIKSKCRSIVNYYINNNYETYEYIRKTKTKEEWIMTRTENMTKLNKQVSEDIKKKIQHFITGMFIEEYKKPNGKWNVSRLGKSLNISRPTIIKHLKDLGEL